VVDLRRGVYLVLPVVIGIDFISRRARLQSIAADILSVEKALEELIISQRTEDVLVMKLVMEYNCLVAGGLSTSDRFYKKHRATIQREWEAVHPHTLEQPESSAGGMAPA